MTGQRRVEEGEYSTHTMIALYPDVDVAEQLAVDGGLDVGDLHVTVVYTGRTDQVTSAQLSAAVEDVLPGRAAIRARVSGLARFSGATSDDLDVVVALIDSPDLDDLRSDVLAALAEHDVDVARTHGFVPHLSLLYLAADDPGPWGEGVFRQEPVDTVFTTLAVKYGDERTEFGFDLAPASELAATMQAFVEGWTAAGAGVSPRMVAGARAAAAVAEDHPGDGLLEATLKLGHLDGVWATIFDRRDQLHADTLAAVLKAWSGLIGGVDVGALVGDAEDAAALLDGTTETRTALVTRVAGYVLAELRSLQHTPSWTELRDAVAAGVAAAHAEGMVDAAALSADKAGHTGGFDYDRAHADALAGTLGRDDVLAAADTALHATLNGVSNRVARRLVAALVDDEPTDQLTDRVRDDLADETVLTVEVANALDVAFSGAVWALALRAGMSMIALVTAGDGKVCQRCVDAEDAGPYALFDAPILPLHYGCRCTFDTAGALPAALWTGYLLGGKQ